MIKRELGTENILNKIEIHIDDYELIVGIRVAEPCSVYYPQKYILIGS